MDGFVVCVGCGPVVADVDVLWHGYGGLLLFVVDAFGEVVVEELVEGCGEVHSGDAVVLDEKPVEEGLVEVSSAFVGGELVAEVAVVDGGEGFVETLVEVFVFGCAGGDDVLGLGDRCVVVLR